MDKKNYDESAGRTFVKGVSLSVLMVVLITAAIGGIWGFLHYTEDDGLIYPNVFVFGVDLSGLTPEEAAELLHHTCDATFAVQPMTVVLPDRTLTLSPADTGASVDVEGLVQAAMAYGRGGNRLENTRARAEAALTTFELDPTPYLTLNEGYIRQVLDQAAASAASVLTQTTVSVSGDVPELALSYEKAIANTDIVHQKLVITKGTPYRNLDTKALLEVILWAYRSNSFLPISFDYQLTPCDPVDLQVVGAPWHIAPVDAVLDTTDYTVSQEKLGYTFDVEAAQALLDAAGEGETVTVPFAYVPAAQTKAAIESTLFQDVLGAVSTSHTNESNRNTNLKLACKALNGLLIRPGETFSYNEALGERTTAKGYKPAGAFMAGKTVETVGGGICQVSSSLYYACLKADLEIVQRTNHGFVVSYVPYGMDATVSWGTLDFKFKNNTDYPIRIEASVSGGQVHIKLIGTDTKDYYVKMTYETVDGPHEGKVVYQEYKYDNKEGYKDGDVIQTAYTGRTVKSYRCRYDKETDELISREYEATSRYSSRDKIVAKVAPKPE